MAESREMPTVQPRHVRALERLTIVSAFLTGAVYVGFKLIDLAPSSTVPINCVAGDDVTVKFVMFAILSFSFYILSSQVAQGMYVCVTLTLLAIADDHLYGEGKQEPGMTEKKLAWRRAVLRYAEPVMLLAAVSFLLGSFFLLLSMICAIQLKFGILSCNILIAVGTFVFSVLAGAGLAFYGRIVAYAVINYLRRP